MSENIFLQSTQYAINPDYIEIIESNIELFNIIDNCISTYKKNMLKELKNQIKEQYSFKKIKAKIQDYGYRKKAYFTFEFEEVTFLLKTEYREDRNFKCELVNMKFELNNKALSLISYDETIIKVEKNQQEKMQISFKYYRNDHFFPIEDEDKTDYYLTLKKLDKKENNIGGNNIEFNNSFLGDNIDLYYSKIKNNNKKINDIVELNVLMNDMHVDEDLDFLITSNSLNGVISNLKISKEKKPTLFNKIFKLK